MPLEVVNEGSSAYLTATFKDKDGQQVAPSAVTYRIDCLTSGTEIKGDTAITPAPSVEIHLTATDNAIQGQENEKELRLVTVKATYGTDDAVNASYPYYVRNLKKVT